MKRKTISKSISAMLFSTAMAATVIAPGSAGTQTVSAEEQAKTVSGLSTSAIKGPVTEPTYDQETGQRNPWLGSYVWYGKYDGQPMKYRVLAPKTTAYGGTTMFLDCENVLYSVKFDEDGKANSGQNEPNEWAGSDLQRSLNGLDFLWSGAFSAPEAFAIHESTIASHSRSLDTAARDCLSSPLSDFSDFTALKGDKIFVLDIGEMIPQYGYFYPGKQNLEGAYWIYWTRSAHKVSSPGSERCIGYVPNLVYSYGSVDGSHFSRNYGASPAFNVDLESVIFSSVVSGKAGEDNAEYKLTLKNNNINLKINTSNGIAGSAVAGSVKTDISTRLLLTGANANLVTQASVLILDKEYKPGNTNNAKILHYEKMYVMNGIEKLQETGTALFALPRNLKVEDWGSSYYVYLLAEQVRGKYETDCASEPIPMGKPLISYVSTKPEITSQPVDKRVTTGEVAQFKVAATGTGTLTYQWQSRKDASSTWTNSGQPGATTPTLSVNAISGLNGWQFRCIVTDKNGYTITNPPATLYVDPKITQQPKDTVALANEVAQFTVAVAGKNPISYQWQSRKNASSAWSNSGQPGAKTATLNVTALGGLHQWEFRCVITDGTGKTLNSDPAKLFVVPKISKHPTNLTVPVSNIAEFTVEAAGKGPLKYQWQSRKDSSSEWSNSGQPGATTAKLKVTVLAGLHGWQFRCFVTDANGSCTLSKEATLYVVPKITKPANATVKAGSKATFTVSATGKGPLKYQWQSRKNSSSAWTNSGQPGAKTPTLEVNAIAGLNGWQFRCVVTDANGMSWGSGVATLTVTK
ncbi:MAG: immunoglobulin domain-containing protein [Lachnospiraceae bacterium]|nr:immunoglobulin domain-containing protein [Lachnospiraceae bacterium]